MSLISSQRGFSLTEIMVGGGILAGVALAGAQMFKDQNMAQRKVSNEQKLITFHQGLVEMMGTSGHCNAAMKAAGRVGQPLPGNFAFSRLAQCTGNCVENGDLDHRAANVSYNSTANLINLNSYVDDTETWKVFSIRHGSSANRTTSGPVILKVTYEMNPKYTEGQVKRITKDLVINVRFENGVFQECLSAQESSVNNLQNDFCKTLNYALIDSTGSGAVNTGQLAKWNPETQQCEIGVNKDCTALGLAVDGIDSNGEVKCKKIIPPQAVPMMQQNTSTQTCTGTQKAVLQVHSSGSLRIICQ